MKMSEKICFMILAGISIFLVGIFDVRAETLGNLVPNVEYCPNGTPSGKTLANDAWYYGCYTNLSNQMVYKTYIQYQINKVGNYDISGYGFVGKNQSNFSVQLNGTSCFIQNYTNTIDSNDAISNYYFKFYCQNVSVNNSIGVSIEGNTFNYGNNKTFIGVGSDYFITPNASNGTTNIENNTNDIKEKMNEDIDNESKTAPNQDEYNKAEEKQNTILEEISDASPDDITFTQDINATGTIWNLIDNIVNTNAKIIGLIISILSIGLIKLILAR